MILTSTTLVILVVITALMSTPLFQRSMLQGYRYFDRSKIYKYHSGVKPWLEAMDRCEEEGGQLVSPRNSHEVNTVLHVLDYHRCPHDAVWLGAHHKHQMFLRRHRKPIKYYRNTREKFTYSLHKVKGCGRGYRSQRNPWDTRCTQEMPFVCEIPLPKLKFYQHEDLQKLFAVPSVPMVWDDAVMFCRDHNSNLAVPRNSQERRILWTILQAIHGISKTEEKIFLGFSRGRNRFLTQQGRIAVHGVIRSRQPGCGALTLNNRVTEVNCDEYLLFICERKCQRLDYYYGGCKSS